METRGNLSTPFLLTGAISYLPVDYTGKNRAGNGNVHGLDLMDVFRSSPRGGDETVEMRVCLAHNNVERRRGRSISSTTRATTLSLILS
jgi:hypothetical protein